MHIAVTDSRLYSLHGKFGKQLIVRFINGQYVVSNIARYVEKPTSDWIYATDQQNPSKRFNTIMVRIRFDSDHSNLTTT
jgi:hypothetical protein